MRIQPTGSPRLNKPGPISWQATGLQSCSLRLWFTRERKPCEEAFLVRAVVVFSGNERSEETLGALVACILRRCPWRVWLKLRPVPLTGVGGLRAVYLAGGAGMTGWVVRGKQGGGPGGVNGGAPRCARSWVSNSSPPWSYGLEDQPEEKIDVRSCRSAQAVDHGRTCREARVTPRHIRRLVAERRGAVLKGREVHQVRPRQDCDLLDSSASPVLGT